MILSNETDSARTAVTVNATSKAAREESRSNTGVQQSPSWTYNAMIGVDQSNSSGVTSPICALVGADNRIVTLTKLYYTGTRNAGGIIYQPYALRRYKLWQTITGTQNTPRWVSRDTQAPLPQARLYYAGGGLAFTFAPNFSPQLENSLTTSNLGIMMKAIQTGTVRYPADYRYDCDFGGETQGIILRSATEAVAFGATDSPTQVVSGKIYVEWTEKDV